MKKFLIWFTPGLLIGILIVLGAGKDDYKNIDK